MALAVVTVGPASAASSHDTCTTTGNGTSYTLQITIPRGAPTQRGFAFGSPGVTIANLNVSGAPGSPSTAGLPRGTSAEWVLSAPASAGTVTVDIQTSAPPKGAFTMLAATKTPKKFFASITCRAVDGGVANAFSAPPVATYSAAKHSWTESVKVPGAGFVSFVQVFSRTGGPVITNGPPPQPLIVGGEVNAAKAGVLALILKPTAAGLAALKKGPLSIYLSVSFKPADGLPETKVLKLTLRA